MDVHAIHSSAVFTGTAGNRRGTGATALPAEAPSHRAPVRTGNTPLLSIDEKAFFEGLFPDSRTDVRAHQVYSDRGIQQQNAPTGTLVDRKG